jgi:hypothetical protein
MKRYDTGICYGESVDDGASSIGRIAVDKKDMESGVDGEERLGDGAHILLFVIRGDDDQYPAHAKTIDKGFLTRKPKSAALTIV